MKKICICTSIQCRHNGSEKLIEEAQTECEGSDIQVETCGCLGGCQFGPNLEVINEKGGRKTHYTIMTHYLKRLISELKG